MSKPKRKGGPLRIPSPEEETPQLTIIDIIEMAIPLINIILTIIFILVIPNFFIDMLLFFMLMLTISFFLSFFIEVWQRKQMDNSKKFPLIFNSFNVSPYVLYAGQFFYGYFFLSFIFLGFIEAVSVLNIIVWVYFGFSLLFIIFVIWAITEYVKEAGEKREELKKNIMD
ncbi:MAG: hypothetical protein ACW972_03475 [Promethearchaeota archaeon]